MKNITYLPTFICILSIIGMIACENTDIQKSLPNNQVKIENRDVPDDCDDCPVTDCCCSVEFITGEAVTLWLCGTTTGLTNIECGPTMPGNCYEIQGYILPLELDEMTEFGYFCMAEISSFYIQNRNTSGGTTDLRISCQAGQIGPQSVDVTLGPGNSAFYSVNEICEIA